MPNNTNHLCTMGGGVAKRTVVCTAIVRVSPRSDQPTRGLMLVHQERCHGCHAKGMQRCSSTCDLPFTHFPPNGLGLPQRPVVDFHRKAPEELVLPDRGHSSLHSGHGALAGLQALLHVNCSPEWQLRIYEQRTVAY